MIKLPLTLISFGSAASSAELPVKRVHDRLCALGYSVELSENGERASVSGTTEQRIAICMFDKQSLTEGRRATLRVLARFTGFARMGLFVGERPFWDEDIVFRCNEFSIWPCSEQELDMRLQRLGASSIEAKIGSRLMSNDLINLNMIGESPLFLEAIARLKCFTRCDAPVLIEGETGTGKELAARAIHYLSGRHEQPFIPVNCGALPDTLLENELFGHAKGAFTDASSVQVGLIAQAEGGTLFLDEVESLTPKGQVALLRFLQEMEYRPLGSSSNIKANVRIITATNVSLDELEGCGEFRRDLLYRLNIMPLRMPALREREDDVFCLAEHFFAKLRFRYGQSEKYLHPSSVDWMRRYDWPGNIRELENLIHRQFLLANDAAVHLGCESINDTAMAAELFCADLSAGFKEAKARAIEAFERDYLTRLLDECGGNVSHAARVAGKERRALGKLIKKYGIDKFQHG